MRTSFMASLTLSCGSISYTAALWLVLILSLLILADDYLNRKSNASNSLRLLIWLNFIFEIPEYFG